MITCNMLSPEKIIMNLCNREKKESKLLLVHWVFFLPVAQYSVAAQCVNSTGVQPGHFSMIYFSGLVFSWVNIDCFFLLLIQNNRVNSTKRTPKLSVSWLRGHTSARVSPARRIPYSAAPYHSAVLCHTFSRHHADCPVPTHECACPAICQPIRICMAVYSSVIICVM